MENVILGRQESAVGVRGLVGGFFRHLMASLSLTLPLVTLGGVGNGIWIGNGATSDWSDAGNWSGGNYPVSSSNALFFREPEQQGSAYLTATQDVVCMYVEMPSRSGVTDNSEPDTLPVTLGPMNLALYPKTDIALDVNVGRRLILDGATVTNCGGIVDKGELIVRNKAFLSAVASDRECNFTQSGARLTVDDAVFDLSRMRTVTTVPLSLSVLHGGFFRFDTLYGVLTVPTNWNARVVDGTVWSPTGCCVAEAGLVPQRSGELVVRATGTGSYTSFAPDFVNGGHYRWGGDVYVTNGTTYSAMSVSQNATLYGRGRLFADTLTYNLSRSSLTLDLAEINLGKTINFYSDGYLICYDFIGGTRFGGYGNWRSSEQVNAYYLMNIYGDIVFDTLDCFDHATKHTFWMKNMYLKPRVSLAYVGGGSVTNHIQSLPVRLSGLTVGADTTAVLASIPNGDWSVPRRLVVQSLTLGEGAKLSIPSILNTPVVCGSASISPTARIRMTLPTTLETKVYPVLCTLEDSVPIEMLDLGTLPEGWEVKTVAGTAYITDGKRSYEQWDVWTGKESGYWSVKNNWVLQPPAVDPARAVRFYGETHTVVTNDTEGVEVLRLQTEGGSAPFVLTGNSIALTATNTQWAISHNSPFPFVIGTPLTSAKNAFMIYSAAYAPVVLRGGVSAPNAKLVVSGNTVVDSAVTAAQFGFSGTADNILSVRRGGTASFTAQSAAVGAAGTLWVDAGGTMSVAGSLRWSAQNDHRIDGLLDVTGTLGGSASQGYFGTGVVQVAATALEAGATADVRIGEGITLKPASWGTLAIDVVSKATLGAVADWEYAVAGGLKVSGLGAVLTVDTDTHNVTVSVPFVGEDFDLVKKGSGTLTLDAANTLKGFVTVEAGTLAWTRDQTFARLTAHPGSTLKFGSRDGVASKLTLGDTVDLTGVKIQAADAETIDLARRGFRAILTVPEFCEIKGALVVPEDYRLKVVATADGGQALLAKIRTGLSVIVR